MGIFKKVTMLAMVGVMSIGLIGCAGSKAPEAQNPDAQGDKLSGNVTLVGSDSMQNVAGFLADEFMALNPDVNIEVQGGGSGASFEPVKAGIADLGLVSRQLKDDEKEKAFTAVPIGTDGIAIVVNSNNPVSDLTKEQVAKIYAGEITNWKEVGGKDMPIQAIAREAGSGTTGAFEEIVMGDKEIGASVLRINQSEGIRSTVAGAEDAIGFFSLYLADDSVKALAIEGNAATDENVKNGSYPVSRPFNVTYLEEPTGVAKAFLDFALSPEGQEIVASEGLITVK